MFVFIISQQNCKQTHSQRGKDIIQSMHKAALILGCAIGALGYETQRNVLKLGQADFDKALEENSDVLVKFYAPWCGHCKNLAQPYLDAADALKELGSSARLAEVDCTVHKPLCQKYGVRGYPTVNFFSKSATEPVKYNSARTKQAIVEWINERVPISKQEKKQQKQQKQATQEVKVQKPKYEMDDKLYKLTQQSFESAKNQFDFLFVKFYAPWCGHCKKMAETWKTLAADNNNAKVAIAEVDCTVQKNVCSQNGIRGYPTLKLFVRGNQPVQYANARTLQAFTSWLDEQTKTLIPGAIPDAKPQAVAEEL